MLFIVAATDARHNKLNGTEERVMSEDNDEDDLFDDLTPGATTAAEKQHQD
jgi:hypothetical protein